MARKIAVLDFETDPFLFGRYPEPFACDIFDGDEHFTFWGADCAEQAIIFLHDKPWLIYAHNGGKFDYHFLLQYLERGSDVTIISGRLAKFSIGECDFRDSINILPIGLGSYNKLEIDYAIFEVDQREQNKAEIIDYLHVDTESLYELVSAFVENYGVRLTQAGAAMAYWRENFCPEEKKDDWLKPTSADYYALFSPFYYGGRVQCFETGIINRNFEAYDINSAYPFAMLSGHPIGAAYFEMEISGDELGAVARDNPHGFFDFIGVSRGALPFRTDNKLLFPDDNAPRRYTVTGWEVNAALETGALDVIGIARALVHSETVSFRGYVEHFYRQRQEAKNAGDKRMDIFAKIFMNALYGKWGANPANYGAFRVGDIGTLTRNVFFHNYEFAGTLGPNILMRRDLVDDETRFYNVATAASITGYVRAFLWRHLAKSSGLIYCDTDCIFADSVVCETGDKLGQWGKEGDFIRGGVAGRKLYAMEHADKPGKYKKASKGARLTAEQIMAVAGGAVVEYQQEAPVYSVSNLPAFVTRKIRLTI